LVKPVLVLMRARWPQQLFGLGWGGTWRPGSGTVSSDRRHIDLSRSIRLMYHNSKIQGILVQYVEGVNGETARHSRVSALV